MILYFLAGFIGIIIATIMLGIGRIYIFDKFYFKDVWDVYICRIDMANKSKQRRMPKNSNKNEE